jgi:hypothetical protein
MDLYQQQQFGFFLQTATERFVSRLEERFRGTQAALQQVREDADGNLLNEFANAVFEDFLLNNVEGACFILRALPRREVTTPTRGTVETVTMEMARQLFAELLLQKTIESLEQRVSYQSV